MNALNPSIADADALTRLHLSENHLGFSPTVWPGVERELALFRFYPDPECRELRARLAAFYGVSTDHIAVGNGTDELLMQLALSAIGHGAKAVISASTFPGYAVSSRLAGALVHEVPLAGYEVDLPAMVAACRAGARAAFLCNPHNPTGTAVTREELSRFLAALATTDTLAIVDEAYAEFAGPSFPSAIPLVAQGARAIVLRTFSKAYGLAGFRVGYAIGPVDVIRRLNETRMALPFSVNRVAQIAARYALEDQAHLENVVRETLQVRSDFCAFLEAKGLGVTPSHTNFVLVRVPGDSRGFATRLHRDAGVLVRDTTAFGLPSHLRISPGTKETLARVSGAIDGVLASQAQRPEATESS